MQEDVSSEKFVVLDEFQRLGDSIFPLLERLPKKGKLLLTGSSLSVARYLFKKGSSLLGILSEYKLDLFKPSDVCSFIKKCSPLNAILIADLFREPWINEFLDCKEDPPYLAYNILKFSKNTILALIGEIFSAEDRLYSERFAAILNAVASGNWNTKKITLYLYNKGIISEPSTSQVIPYLNILIKIGLIDKLPLLQGKQFYYRLHSSVMDLFFYLSHKKRFHELDIPYTTIKETIKRKLSFYAESFLSRLLAEINDLQEGVHFTPTEEFDIVLLKGKKPFLMAEVKTGKSTLHDLELFYERTKNFDTIKIFFSPNKIESYKEVITLTFKEVLQNPSKLKFV